MKYIVASILFLFGAGSYAQTSVSKGPVSGVWDISGSPYKILGDITIQDDSTLEIGPGVKVEFVGKYQLSVKGRLLVKGTAKDSVLFTSGSTGWKGVSFDTVSQGNDTSVINYAIMENGNNYYEVLPTGGAISIWHSQKLKLLNSTIRDCLGSRGGAIMIYGDTTNKSSIVIDNCVFTRNRAKSSGGAIYVTNHCRMNISNSRITNNRVNEGSGGGVLIGYFSSLVMNSCEIKENYADGKGGGIYISGFAEAMIAKTSVENNTAWDDGGGIYVNDNSDLEINESSISQNIVALSKFQTIPVSGLLVNKESKAVIKECAFYKNRVFKTSNEFILVIGLFDYSTVEFTNCKILNNDGGVYANYFIDIKFDNCLIANNDNPISLTESTQASFYSSTISNNNGQYRGTQYEGGVIMQKSTVNFYNCILHGNEDQNNRHVQMTFIDELSHAHFYNCLVQGGKAKFIGVGSGSKYKGIYSNNVDADPLFVNPTSGIGSFSDARVADWQLKNECKSVSPAVNKGTIFFRDGYKMPFHDLTGEIRLRADSVDIGAYEVQTPKNGIWVKSPDSGVSEGCMLSEHQIILDILADGPQVEWQKSTDSGKTYVFHSVGEKVEWSSLGKSDSNTYYRALISNRCSLRDTFHTILKVHDLPMVHLGNDTVSCSGLTIVLGNLLSPQVGDSIFWSTSETSSTISVSPATETQYSILIRNQVGCEAIDSIWVRVGDLPIFNLGNDTTIDIDSSIIFYAKKDQEKYLWEDDSNDEKNTYSGATLGLGQHLIWSEVLNASGCIFRDSLHLTVKDLGGLSDLDRDYMLVYPNPTSRYLYLDSEHIDKNLTITLSTLGGNLVFMKKFQQGNDVVEIDLRDIPKGMYMLEGVSSKNRYHNKIVVQ